MKVVIIGSGNVATILGRRILKAGHEIIEVAGRNETTVAALALELKAKKSYNIGKIDGSADIYIIAVSDAAVSIVAKELRVKEKAVVHVAGSVPKSILSECSENYGIIYPVQSLRKQLKDGLNIPVLIDGNNQETQKALMKFGSTWANSVELAADKEIAKLHIAAVVVNNFTNHLMALTEKYCVAEHLNFNILYPLLEETIKRIKANRPSEVQTGPSVRNDINTIEKHLTMLSDHPYLKELYQLFSSNIIDFYRRSK